MIRLSIILAGALLAGCANAPWVGQAKQLMDRGQCQAARGVVYANEHDPGMQAGWVASIYADCDKNMAESVKQWTLSARYGNTFAQRTLAQLGQPVPTPDLAGRPADPAGAIVRGYSVPPNPAAFAPPVNCTSRQVGTTVQTTC